MKATKTHIYGAYNSLHVLKDIIRKTIFTFALIFNPHHAERKNRAHCKKRCD